jgi:hypothetical protein
MIGRCGTARPSSWFSFNLGRTPRALTRTNGWRRRPPSAAAALCQRLAYEVQGRESAPNERRAIASNSPALHKALRRPAHDAPTRTARPSIGSTASSATSMPGTRRSTSSPATRCILRPSNACTSGELTRVPAADRHRQDLPVGRKFVPTWPRLSIRRSVYRRDTIHAFHDLVACHREPSRRCCAVCRQCRKAGLRRLGLRLGGDGPLGQARRRLLGVRQRQLGQEHQDRRRP